MLQREEGPSTNSDVHCPPPFFAQGEWFETVNAHFADVFGKRPKTPNRRLYDAAHAGDISEVTNAVATGADINYRSDVGWTALHRATGGGHPLIVEYLLQQGAKVNVVGFGDAKPRTAFDIAVQAKNPRIQRLLSDNGGTGHEKLRDFTKP